MLTLTWSEALPLLLMLAGNFIAVYASLHLGPWTLSITISSGWVSPVLPQLTVLANNSSHRCVSSVLTCTMSALFPFSLCQWQGAFTAPSGLAVCWPTAPELWHFAHQWPLLEQPLQMAFHAGQLSWPGECEQVQLGYCGVQFCGFFF